MSLNVDAGEVVALLGATGAGKTTTLRSILGLTPPRRGTIRFDGRDVTHQSTHKIARAGVAWVPEERRVVPSLTVRRNLSIAEKRTKFRRWTLGECCEIFSALEYLLERDSENLSGGEMQMVAISRALLGSPGLVLMDEPSQGLAPKVVQDVMRTVQRLKKVSACCWSSSTSVPRSRSPIASSCSITARSRIKAQRPSYATTRATRAFTGSVIDSP